MERKPPRSSRPAHKRPPSRPAAGAHPNSELRRSEALWQTAIESFPFDFFVVDASGCYVIQNGTCRKHWGDIVGRRPEDVAPDQKTLAIWKHNNRRAFKGKTIKEEVSYAVGGELRWMYNVIAPVRERGRIRGILGVNIDITELKRAEERLAQLAAQLQAERKSLKEKNIALTEILDHLNQERERYRERLWEVVQQTVVPALDNLGRHPDRVSQAEVARVKDSLVASLGEPSDPVTARVAALTSREIEIAELVRRGTPSKEIAKRLGLSELTIHKHRERLRRKLGLINKGLNLATYLRTHWREIEYVIRT